MAKKTIKVKSVYCEMLNEPITQQILARSLPTKMSYWISRAIEKIRQEAKAYGDQKDKLIKEHEDIKKRDDEKKKGDCLACGRKGELPPGQTFLKDALAFQKEQFVFQEIEIDLGINKIKIDLDDLEKWFEKRNEKGLTGSEFEYLLPFFEIEEDKKSK